MNRASTTFHALGQTDPAIFSNLLLYEEGASAEGRYRQWEIGMTLEGKCDWRTEGVVLGLEPGHLLLTRPDTWMSWHVPKGEKWRVAYAVFQPSPRCEHWLHAQQFVAGTARIRLHDEAFASRVRRGFLAMHRIYTRTVLHRDDWTMLALERILLTVHTHTARARTPLDPRVSRAVQFIHDHFAEPLTVDDIARAAHLSGSQVSLLFAEQVGVAPIQYLERLRLERAAEMLHFTSYKIQEIAAAAGYRDPDYFSGRFRRYAGVSPRAYRRAKQAR